MFMSPARNMSVGFTHITSVTASTEKLINYIGLETKTVFSTFKLASLFSTKNKVPFGLKSYVVNKFLCAGCNASYVSETYRHISTRTHEHLETDESFNIYRRLLKNPQCKSICDESCFSILDSARTKYTLKLKEGMYIKWLKSSLNKQIKPLITAFTRFICYQ